MIFQEEQPALSSFDHGRSKYLLGSMCFDFGGEGPFWKLLGSMGLRNYQ